MCTSSQTCSSGNCLTKDGYDCVNASECASNTCNTFYADQDGDTHGAAGSPKQVCGISAPAGYVTSKDDCCDVGGDAGNIFPGQPKFFTSQATSCNKGWDYNCSNNIEQEITQTACDPNPAGLCPAGYFWYSGGVPACGNSGSRSNCLELGAVSYCGTSMPASYTQGCH
jgi:hypothetical protein